MSRRLLAFALLLLPGCSALPAGVPPWQRWSAARGGVLAADDAGGAPLRAAEALARLAPACACPGMTIRVLGDDGLVAYAFRDGSLFVSRGLVARLDADELAAAVAHELGHLARGGHDLPARDAEARADRHGMALLAASGIAPDAMSRLLRRLSDARAGTDDDLRVRIAALQGVGPERVASRD